jgi:hypothetical protein
MRLFVRYLNDAAGNIEAVQLPFGAWKRVLHALRGHRQEMKVKADIAAAL